MIHIPRAFNDYVLEFGIKLQYLLFQTSYNFFGILMMYYY